MINFKLINPDKCYLILSDKENRGINVETVAIKKLLIEKLLGAFFHKRATFGYHIESMCTKPGVGIYSTTQGSTKNKIFAEMPYSTRSLATLPLFECVIAVVIRYTN